MIAVLGGVGAAAAWAVSTLCSSRSSRMIEPMAVVAWVMLVGLVITAPLAAADGVPSALHGSVLFWLALSGAGNVAGLVISYYALRIGQVSLVAPIVSAEGAIAALISILAGHRLAPSVAVTLAVIAAGVGLASTSPAAAAAEVAAALPGRGRPTAVILAATAAVAFGASLYATGRAGARLPSSWVVLAARLIGALALALPLAVRGRLRLTRPAVGLVIASGICEVVGFYSYTLGSRHGLAIAAVLSSQFAVLALIGSYVLFKERLHRIQLAGVGCVIVGVALLSALRA
jgi:drug/metabolite transporter (DMT)-like permease